MLKHTFNPSILRAYDIRGIYQDQLNPKDAYFLGRAIATIMNQRGLAKTVCLAYDGRLSSPELHTALTEGLLHSGIEIHDIGLVATPVMYFASQTLNTAAGIMITGSHNPGDQNGFKIVMSNKSFYGDDIQSLQTVTANGEYVEGLGSINFVDIKPSYVEHLIKFGAGLLGKKLKVAWDPGNGATGELVRTLSTKLDCEHLIINDEIDGHFPNHHPDPTLPENMEQLIALVLKNKCDIGIAFDGDGDRLGLVDNKGRMIFGDQTLLLLTQDLVKRDPNLKVVCDVKTSDLILNEIEKLGATPVMWKTGHSLIKVKMHEIGAQLAGEMSGHLFFGENYFGFDDALFGACKILNILSNKQETLADLIDVMPKAFATPELRIDIDEARKFRVIDELKSHLVANSVNFNDLDGIRVKLENGWWVVRASNTQSCLVMRVEGSSQELLDTYLSEVITLFDKFNIDTQPLKQLVQ